MFSIQKTHQVFTIEIWNSELNGDPQIEVDLLCDDLNHSLQDWNDGDVSSWSV
jgi:hypothetical protein